MKIFIGIAVFFGTTICTFNSLCSRIDKPNNNAKQAGKDPTSNLHLSISHIPNTSSNNNPTSVLNIVATMLLNDTGTTTSPAVKSQKDQARGQSDAQSRSKNTVSSSINDTKSPEYRDTFGLQQKLTEENKIGEQYTRINKQVESIDRILNVQGLQVANVTEVSKSKHFGYEADSTDVIKTKDNLTLSQEWPEQITKDKRVTEHDLPWEKKISCSTMWPECSRKYLNDTVSEAAKDLLTFTLDLFQTLSALDSRPNLVVSPISVSLALSQLMIGTNGKTKDDMLNALYKGVKNDHCIHEAIQNLTTQKSFLSASEVFYNKELQIHEEFMDQSLKFYGSKGILLPKDKKKSLEKINSWVSQRTKQLIPTLLQELPSDLQLILVNVIHYQGKWLSQFDPKLTKNENFRRLSSDLVKVPIMNAHRYPLQILKDTYLQAQVARFPLSDNCSLLIFLPLVHAVDGLKIMEKRLNQEIVKLLMTQLEEVPIRATSVSLPQLKVDTNFGLNEALSSLGLYDLFEYPNLCALSNSTDLAVSDVHHRALLEIKEEGVKAASASAVTIARTATVFAVRRPFLFILVADNSKVPIFIGHINDPSQ